MLSSPADDFTRQTLASVSGTLGKLDYVAGLRQTNGDYFHWGMARRHGEATANMAIAQAHADLCRSVLRMPMRALWEELKNAATQQSTGAREYIERLLEKGDRLIPAQLQGGSRRHFNSVLLALCYLAGVPVPKADRVA